MSKNSDVEILDPETLMRRMTGEQEWKSMCVCQIEAMKMKLASKTYVPHACGCMGTPPEWHEAGYDLKKYSSLKFKNNSKKETNAVFTWNPNQDS